MVARAKAQYDLVARDKTDRAFDQVKRKLGGFRSAISGVGAALGGVLAVGGFARFVKGALDAGDEIQKLAIQTGASTEFLSEMRGVAELSGASYEKFTKALKRQAQFMDRASAGAKAQTETLAQLGLSLSDLQGLSPEQLFLTMGDALNKVEDANLRAALANNIFRGTSEDVLRITQQGSAAINELREEQRKLGNSLSRDQVDAMAEANDALSRLSQAFKGAGNALAAEFAGPIKSLADFLRNVVRPAIGVVAELFNIAGNALGGFAATMGALLAGDFRGAFETVKLLFGDITKNIKRINQLVTGGVAEAVNEIAGPALATKKSAVAVTADATGSVLAAAGDRARLLADERNRVSGSFGLTGTGKTAVEDPQLQRTNALLENIAQTVKEPTVAVAG